MRTRDFSAAPPLARASVMLTVQPSSGAASGDWLRSVAAAVGGPGLVRREWLRQGVRRSGVIGWYASRDDADRVARAGGLRSPLARRDGQIFHRRAGRARPPRDADDGVARTARARTLNSRSTGRMQLQSSGRNASGSAWRLWIICLTHFLCTARLTCASLRIFPTVGTVMATATDARWRVERVSGDGTAGACACARAFVEAWRGARASLLRLWRGRTRSR